MFGRKENQKNRETVKNLDDEFFSTLREAEAFIVKDNKSEARSRLVKAKNLGRIYSEIPEINKTKYYQILAEYRNKYSQ